MTSETPKPYRTPDRIQEHNRRLQALGLQPVEVCPMWTHGKQWAAKLAQGRELLAGAPRPKHEEWTDQDLNRWIADGTGKLHNVMPTPRSQGCILQGTAQGFVLEITRRPCEQSDFASFGLGPELEYKLIKLGGPFGPYSWLAYGRIQQEIQQHGKDTRTQERSQEQTKQFDERVRKRTKKHFEF